MQITQDIIKILPFKKEFKDDLLERYDKFNSDQKYAAERIIWDFYDSVYENRLDINMKLAFERAKKNEEKLDSEFYERVRKLTDQQLQVEFSQEEATVDLSETREALRDIIKDSSPSDKTN